MGYQLRRKALWAAKSTGWARVVVGEIADAIQDDAPTGDAWPGERRIARMYGVSVDTISRAVREAEAAGDIQVERVRGRVNHYILSAELAASCDQPQVAGSRTLRVGYPQDAATTTRRLRPDYPQVAALTIKEPQVEPQENAEATDTGPIPFSEPDSFTRKARAAGIGSQPSKRVAVAKQKAAAQFDLGELEHAPAIKVHRDVCGYVPMTPGQARQIVAGVNGDAETTWRANLNFWMAQGYRANNIDGQTERHATEKRRASARATQPAAAKIGGWQPAKGMYPQVPDRTPEQMAEIHRQDLERTAARRAAQVDVIDHSKTTEVPF